MDGLDKDKDIARRVCEVVLALYNSLHSSGKPQAGEDSEFTVVAAIVQEGDSNVPKYNVVSLATGTKCIGKNSFHTNLTGNLIHDSHAETLARRAFQVFLLRWIELLSSDCCSNAERTASPLLWNIETATAQLKPDVRYYLFVSDSPCGAASTYPSETFEASSESFMHVTGAKALNQSGVAAGECCPSYCECSAGRQKYVHKFIILKDNMKSLTW